MIFRYDGQKSPDPRPKRLGSSSGSDKYLYGLFKLTFNLHIISAFLGASGFAAASVVYNLPPPAFVLDGFTVAELEVSRQYEFTVVLALTYFPDTARSRKKWNANGKHDRHPN